MKAFLAKHSGLVSLILIMFLTTGVYLNSFNNGFSLDDEDFIIESDFIKSWQNAITVFTPAYLDVSAKHVDLNRPVMTWSLMSDYHVWGMNPFGYHLTNSLLHTVNALLIYFLGSMLLKDSRVSLLAAILFGIHPVHTEAVNGINFREDLLVTTFFVLSLITFIKARRKLSLLLFASALLSKESGIVFPLISILYQYVSGKDAGLRKGFNRSKGYYIGLSVLIGGYLAGLFMLLNNANLPGVKFFSPDWYQLIISAGAIIADYVRLLLFPIQLSIDHNPVIVKSIFNIWALSGIGFVVGSFMYSAFFLKKRAMGSFFFLWFLITLFPVAGTLYQQPSAERFLYLPSIGIIFLMASVSVFIYDKIMDPGLRKVVISSIFIIILSYSLIGIGRNRAWKDDYSLWSDAVMKAPRSQRANFNLGRQYHNRRDYPMALRYYNQALQRNSADMIDIDPVEPLINIGLVYGDMGKHDLAVKYLEEAARRAPLNALSRNNLGVTYFEQGRYDEAVYELKKALNSKPDYPDVYINLGIIYGQQGLLDQAIKELLAAIRLKPDSADAHYNLGITYLKQGRYDAAISEFGIALKLKPDYKEAYQNIEALRKKDWPRPR